MVPGMDHSDRAPAFRLDHVAVGVWRGPEATPFLVGELGGRRHIAGPGMGFRFWQYRYAGGGLLELLEPDGPPGGFLHRFLERRGPGVHHVTFKVPNLRAAMQRARERGYEVVNANEEFPGWKEAFLHPRQAQGIVVQLAESEGGEPPGLWAFPPEPPAGEAVALVGLRLSARDAGRARHQWQDLLSGDCEARDRELVFRWPESPLQIRVAIDAAAPEGPRGLEIRSPRPLALPEGPHPVLGACFLSAP